jgi:hypothetical protein
MCRLPRSRNSWRQTTVLWFQPRGLIPWEDRPGLGPYHYLSQLAQTAAPAKFDGRMSDVTLVKMHEPCGGSLNENLENSHLLSNGRYLSFAEISSAFY